MSEQQVFEDRGRRPIDPKLMAQQLVNPNSRVIDYRTGGSPIRRSLSGGSPGRGVRRMSTGPEIYGMNNSGYIAGGGVAYSGGYGYAAGGYPSGYHRGGYIHGGEYEGMAYGGGYRNMGYRSQYITEPNYMEYVEQPRMMMVEQPAYYHAPRMVAQPPPIQPIRQTMRVIQTEEKKGDCGHEVEIQNLKHENEKMQIIVNEKDEEVNSWKEKCQHLEDHVKHHKEAAKKAARRPEPEPPKQDEGLLLQISQFNLQLSRANDELEDWKRRYAELEITVTDLRSENYKIKDYLAQIEFLNEEVDRLNLTIRSSKRELEKWQSKCSELEIKMQSASKAESEGMTMQLTNINFQLNGAREEIEMWKRRYSELEMTVTELRSANFQITEMQAKIEFLNDEMSKLNTQLRKSSREIESWKAKYSELEISSSKYKQYEIAMKDFAYQYVMMSLEIERLQKGKIDDMGMIGMSQASTSYTTTSRTMKYY